ncbi:MAG TPA: carbohydrate-binding family 9-like protein [Fimbriimonadaceae bacterium]
MLVSLLALTSMAQMQLSPTSVPRGYVVYKTTPITIDGNIDKPEWQKAPWTEDFLDIQGDNLPKPRFRTRAKMLWDDKNFYVAAEIDEPHVMGTLTQHDSVIFQDNDFEIFMDPNDDNHLYSEFEMNALNTTWDLLLIKPYRSGAPPVDGFELKGLKTGVKIQGTINDASDTDKGWTAEICIPFHALEQIAGCPCPPRDGDQWRINFSRVEWHFNIVDGKYVKVPHTPEDNWVWSPQTVIDMHRPEHWGIMQFSDQTEGPVALHPHAGLEEKFALCRLWDAERAYRDKHGKWGTLNEIGYHEPGVKLYVTPDLFEGMLGDYRIDQTLRFWKEGK